MTDTPDPDAKTDATRTHELPVTHLRALHAAAPDYVELEWLGLPYLQTQYATDEVKAFYEAAYQNVPLLLDEVERARKHAGVWSERLWREEHGKLESQLATMTAARDEACRLAESLRKAVERHDAWDETDEPELNHKLRISELLKVGKTTK